MFRTCANANVADIVRTAVHHLQIFHYAFAWISFTIAGILYLPAIQSIKNTGILYICLNSRPWDSMPLVSKPYFYTSHGPSLKNAGILYLSLESKPYNC
jgi:hypothetical protein